MSIRQLIINPGSTSTKLAVYEDEKEVAGESVAHAPEELAACGGLYEQISFRLEAIRRFLDRQNLSVSDFDDIMCRGGMVWGIGTGGYRVNDE
ncbi:MAG: butyrate kinase, partial [Hornefia butyriciproducens]|nr:butyrate kinase [Hornefia butyriciproducens]